jgi:hypothetical protein
MTRENEMQTLKNILTIIDETENSVNVIYESNNQIELLKKSDYEFKEVENE